MPTERIVIDLAVMMGKPVIRGAGITVELVLRKLAEGAAEADLLYTAPQPLFYAFGPLFSAPNRSRLLSSPPHSFLPRAQSKGASVSRCASGIPSGFAGRRISPGNPRQALSWLCIFNKLRTAQICKLLVLIALQQWGEWVGARAWLVSSVTLSRDLLLAPSFEGRVPRPGRGVRTAVRLPVSYGQL